MLRSVSRLGHVHTLSTKLQTHSLLLTLSRRQYSMYDPDYLNVEPEIPLHDTLSVTMRGYDFPVLESFAKYVHHTADRLGLATAAFAVPARVSKIHTLKPHSSHVQNDYQLSLYERVVQVDNLNATLAPIFLEVLQSNMPAGVEMTIQEPNPEDEEFRYVPDLTLLELKAEQSVLEKVKEDRKKK